MTQIMSQPGFGLSAPSSRQDIVSALLDGYGNDFGSPYDYSPSLKELPPPPPPEEKDGSPMSLMNMKFQLRVDEPQSPLHYNEDRKNSLESSPPTKIVYRSLSRSSKPHSLKLTVSNGSTAIVPPLPSVPAPISILSSTTAAKPLPIPSPEPPVVEERPLPPPPPEKSTRRQQPPMGSNQSKNLRLRDRKDSVESQDVPNQSQSDVSNLSPVVKRKAVPKFRSLADLQVGPRGGKNGPLPPAPKNQSNESVATVTPASIAQERSAKSSNRSQSVEEVSRKPLPAPRPTVSAIEAPAKLPPTPDEQSDVPPPAPPKKIFTMGLPSNPRSRGQETPTSAKHSRGKSSTGFDLMNSKGAPKSAQLTRPTNLTTITPGPTPSPNKTTTVEKEGSTFPNAPGPQSPVSPISPEEGSRRPFSYEAPIPAQPQRQQIQQPPRPQSRSPVSPPAATTAFPPRTTSRPTAPQPQPQPNPFSSLPSQQQARSPSPPAPTNPFASPPSSAEDAPFTPLTVRPSPSAAAPITAKHLHCYASHANYVWSKNECQPMACMVCHENSRERKWACTWCYLRVCLACSDELMRTPGRNVQRVIEKRGKVAEENVRGRSPEGSRERSGSRNGSATRGGNVPQMVIWEVENEEKEDFS